jgi:hypothetical protein
MVGLRPDRGGTAPVPSACRGFFVETPDMSTKNPTANGQLYLGEVDSHKADLVQQDTPRKRLSGAHKKLARAERDISTLYRIMFTHDADFATEKMISQFSDEIAQKALDALRS